MSHREKPAKDLPLPDRDVWYAGVLKELEQQKADRLEGLLSQVAPRPPARPAHIKFEIEWPS